MMEEGAASQPWRRTPWRRGKVARLELCVRLDSTKKLATCALFEQRPRNGVIGEAVGHVIVQAHIATAPRDGAPDLHLLSVEPRGNSRGRCAEEARRSKAGAARGPVALRLQQVEELQHVTDLAAMWERRCAS